VALAAACVAALSEGMALLALAPLMRIAEGVSQRPDSWLVELFGRLVPATSPATQTIRAAVMAFVVLGILAVATQSASRRLVTRLRFDLERAARHRAVAAVLAMRWQTYQALRLGEMTRATLVDGWKVAEGADMFVQAVANAIAAALLFAVGAVFSPSQALTAGAFAAVAFSAYRLSARGTDAWRDRYAESLRRVGDRTVEGFQHLKYLRASGSVELLRTALFADYAEHHDAASGLRRRLEMSQSTLELAAVLLTAVLLVAGTAAGEQLSLELFVFLGIISRVTPRALRATWMWSVAKEHGAWARVAEETTTTLERAVEERPQPGASVPSMTRGLSLRGVRFRHDAAARAVLDGVDFHVARGEAVAVVGPSGCGKSTLLDLLSGLLLPTDGVVAIDGSDLRTCDREGWRRRLGVLTQDAPVFAGTILANVVWGDPEPDADRVHRALERAALGEFVAQLPAGVETIVGERGGNLSGGQRQRLALARALYRETALLLLDEPTSGLDSETARELLDTLRELKGDVAMVIVTHDPAAAAVADRVVRLRDGRIDERAPSA
jgi:ABC-type multidrug transport system fused ATPase/permease subunit